MEPVNGPAGLVALSNILRRKAAESAPAAARKELAAANSQREAVEHPGLGELERQLRAKLKEAGSEGVNSAGVRRWVITTILSFDLDAEFQNEPKFISMVQSIQRSIDGDATLKGRFDKVVRRLSR